MTPAELGACFDHFTATAFRLETLQHYAGEEGRLEAFRLGLPLPVRSVRTSLWLARIADNTLTGKRWQRVRIVEEPLTEYTRYEMVSYAESQAVGEEIRVGSRSASSVLTALERDFWLMDAEAPDAFALLMDYSHDGQFLGAELTTDPEMLAVCRMHRDLALEYSVPLNEYLAGKAAQAA